MNKKMLRLGKILREIEEERKIIDEIEKEITAAKKYRSLLNNVFDGNYN